MIVAKPSVSGLRPLPRRESNEGLTPTSPASPRQESCLSWRAASSAEYSAAVLIVVLAMPPMCHICDSLSPPTRSVLELKHSIKSRTPRR